jgi:hypothetical protein
VPPFRVEFSRGASSPSGVGYNIDIVLTLEKGAQSSFKEIFASLRLLLGDVLSNPSSPRPPVPLSYSFSFRSVSTR